MVALHPVSYFVIRAITTSELAVAIIHAHTASSVFVREMLGMR